MPLSLLDAHGPRQCPTLRWTRMAAGARRLWRVPDARDALPGVLERIALLSRLSDDDHLAARVRHRAAAHRHDGVGYHPLLTQVPVGAGRRSDAAAFPHQAARPPALVAAARAVLHCNRSVAARGERSDGRNAAHRD